MHLFLMCSFVVRVPLRRRQSLRKKLRARGQLSEFWKSQSLDMIQFTESCTMEKGANEPLINYLDVRHPGAGLGAGRGQEGSAWVTASGQQHLAPMWISPLGGRTWTDPLGSHEFG